MSLDNLNKLVTIGSLVCISVVKTGWIQDKLGEDLFTSFHVFKVSFFALCKQSFDISSNILDLVSLKAPHVPMTWKS